MGKLSPGERAVNWAKALAVLCTGLVTLLGYTNREAIGNFISTAPPTVEDVQPVEDGRLEQSVKDIIKKLKQHDAELAQLRAQSRKDDTGLQGKIDANTAEIRSWH